MKNKEEGQARQKRINKTVYALLISKEDTPDRKDNDEDDDDASDKENEWKRINKKYATKYVHNLIYNYDTPTYHYTETADTEGITEDREAVDTDGTTIITEEEEKDMTLNHPNRLPSNHTNDTDPKLTKNTHKLSIYSCENHTLYFSNNINHNFNFIFNLNYFHENNYVRSVNSLKTEHNTKITPKLKNSALKTPKTMGAFLVWVLSTAAIPFRKEIIETLMPITIPDRTTQYACKWDDRAYHGQISPVFTPIDAFKHKLSSLRILKCGVACGQMSRKNRHTDEWNDPTQLYYTMVFHHKPMTKAPIEHDFNLSKLATEHTLLTVCICENIAIQSKKSLNEVNCEHGSYWHMIYVSNSSIPTPTANNYPQSNGHYDTDIENDQPRSEHDHSEYTTDTPDEDWILSTIRPMNNDYCHSWAIKDHTTDDEMSEERTTETIHTNNQAPKPIIPSPMISVAKHRHSTPNTYPEKQKMYPSDPPAIRIANYAVTHPSHRSA